MPPSGQASTVQGELLRSVEKFRDDAIRNGNGNWDQGFEILLLYIEERLLDPSVFSVEKIAETRAIIEQMRNYENPLLADEPYDKLGDQVVEYFRYYGSLPHTPNPELRR